MRGKLVLEDGYIVSGQMIGAPGEAWGEVVFNTSMTGYQEILTDPSYCGQIIVLTYPLIGNYGVAEADSESPRPFARGLVVRECCPTPSNPHHDSRLASFLRRHRLVGLAGPDTRALVRRIRSAGTLRGIIAPADQPDDQLVARAQRAAWPGQQSLIATVSPSRPTAHGPDDGPVVVLIDTGAKAGIVRDLVARGCRVWRVPHDYPAAEVKAMRPAGVVFANGPGDPANATATVTTCQRLIGSYPILGICLGHQIIGRAFGAQTYKLKFGHRGVNHPVQEVATGRAYVTAQNHGFAVDTTGLASEVTVSHVNLNDHTVEGLAHKTLPVYSVQYHPEAAPGPRDSGYLFDRFVSLITSAPETDPTTARCHHA